MEHSLVYNIEPASPSMIRSLDRHCLHRVADGASAIDPNRSKLNQIIVGKKGGVLAALNALYESGVQKPAKQSESPYLRIVVSASPSYFRPDNPSAVGTWDDNRLKAWTEAIMNQLQSEHGPDLIYAELHLDEDTPHIHAVVAPTYGKKPRKPGKKKRNETPDEFEARKACVVASEGIRTVGRASHPELSKKGSFQRLRERMALAVDHLGIEYGEDRSVDAPDGISTREWVKDQAAQLRTDRKVLDAERMKAKTEIDQAHLEASMIVTTATEQAAKIITDAKVAVADERRSLEQDKARLSSDEDQLDKDRSELNMEYMNAANDLAVRETALKKNVEVMRGVVGVIRSAIDYFAEKLGLTKSNTMLETVGKIEKRLDDLTATKNARPDASGPGL